MTISVGRVGSAETGSREPGLASRPGPSGFDPARDEAQGDFIYGNRRQKIFLVTALELESLVNCWKPARTRIANRIVKETEF